MSLTEQEGYDDDDDDDDDNDDDGDDDAADPLSQAPGQRALCLRRRGSSCMSRQFPGLVPGRGHEL